MDILKWSMNHSGGYFLAICLVLLTMCHITYVA